MWIMTMKWNTVQNCILINSLTETYYNLSVSASSGYFHLGVALQTRSVAYFAPPFIWQQRSFT